MNYEEICIKFKVLLDKLRLYHTADKRREAAQQELHKLGKADDFIISSQKDIDLYYVKVNELNGVISECEGEMEEYDYLKKEFIDSLPLPTGTIYKIDDLYLIRTMGQNIRIRRIMEPEDEMEI